MAVACAPTPLSQSPSYLLISVPNQFPNLHLKIRPRIPDNRVFIRIFETCALPLNALSTILSLCDSLLFFLFFFFPHYFPFFNTPRMRYARVSRSTGLSQRNSDPEVGIQMNWSGGIAEGMGGGDRVKQSSNTRQWQMFVPCTPSFSTQFKVEWGREGAHYNP